MVEDIGQEIYNAIRKDNLELFEKHVNEEHAKELSFGKSHPDEQTSATIAPHFANHIVDNVTNWENDQSCSHIGRAERNLFCLQYVCRNQAHAKQYAV